MGGKSGFTYTYIYIYIYRVITVSVHVIIRVQKRINILSVHLMFVYVVSLALHPSAGYGLLWLCSPARAMASSSTRFPSPLAL
jgi:hypothetical protein